MKVCEMCVFMNKKILFYHSFLLDLPSQAEVPGKKCFRSGFTHAGLCVIL